MLPVNFGVALACAVASDRVLLLGSQAVCVAGFFLLLSYGGSIPNLYVFICGTAAVFSSTIVMEAVAMSLLSKKIPAWMAKGILNAGLLATQAGSLGRFLGNTAITGIGDAVGLGTLQETVNFDRVLYGTMIGCAALTLAYTGATFKRLVAE